MQPAEEIIIVHAGMRNYANSCEFFLAEMNGERRGKGEGNREFRFVLSSSFIRFLIIFWRKDSGSFFLSFFFFSIQFLYRSYLSLASVIVWKRGSRGGQMKAKTMYAPGAGGQRHHNAWKREHPPRRIFEIPSITIYRPRCAPSSALLYYSLRKM